MNGKTLAEELPDAKPASSISEDDSYKIKILVIDNDKNNVKLITDILAKNDYFILKAFNIEEAFNIVGNYIVDLIIFDIAILIDNGFHAIHKIKTISSSSNIPVIIMTENLDPINKELAIDFGGNEFLNKPFSDAELTVRVASVLKLKVLQEQLDARRKLEINFAMGISATENMADIDDQFKILLVEDGINDAKLIQAVLGGHQYRVTVAETGEKAIEITQNNHFDLVLLDIMLPDINGYEVCQKIKQLKNYENIPVIFITGFDDQEFKIKCLELGADDFFVKPIAVSELKVKVKSLLNKKIKLDELRDIYQATVNLANIDGLTELYKRSYFLKHLDKEIARSMRYNSFVSIMMIDIDNFKLYNDTIGHLGGDIILRMVGKTIIESIREVDLAARYGGEEFIILLPSTIKEDALVIAKRIQSGLLTLTMPSSSELPLLIKKLTVSIGVVDFPFCSSTASQLIKKADEMLYQAKNTGKNKVCLPI